MIVAGGFVGHDPPGLGTDVNRLGGLTHATIFRLLVCPPAGFIVRPSDSELRMPSFSTRRRVPFTPRQMFDLVADVEQYPRFLPLCEGLVVKSRELKDGKELLVADMSVGYKAIRESFISRVLLDRTGERVLVTYVDGPFKFLENRWQFVPAPGGGTDVLFHLSYEMKSRMFGLLVGAVFDKAFRKFVEAFEGRAREVYGLPRDPALNPA